MAFYGIYFPLSRDIFYLQNTAVKVTKEQVYGRISSNTDYNYNIEV